MAGKINIPNAAIFQNDPEDALYARSVLQGPDSGIAYMFKNANDIRRGEQQQQYMQGVSEANKIAAVLEQQDMQSKLLTEALKVAPNYADKGLPIEMVPLLARLFTGGGTDPQTRDASSLPLDVMRAAIAKDRASAAASGASASAEKEEYRVEDTASGTGSVVGVFKGPTARARAEDAARRAQEQRKQGGAYGPRGTVTYPPTPAMPSPLSPSMKNEMERRRALGLP